MLFAHPPSKCVVACILILSSFNLLAQEFEFIKFQAAYYPLQPIEEPAVDGEVGFFEWGAQIAVPQALGRNKKTILIHKIGYANLRVDAEASPSAGLEAEKYYHTISYNLGLVQALNPNWRLVVNFIPTLASDFEENLSGDDLLFQANALAVNTKRERLKYGFGLAYTTRLGRQILIPMGLLKYNTKKLALDVVLPNKLDIMIKTPKHIFSYGLKAGLNGGGFNTTAELQPVSKIVDEVGYSRLVSGPAITCRLKNAINFHLQGGIAVGRRFEFVDTNEAIIDRTPGATPIFAVGLSFAPTNKNPEAGLNN